MYMCCYFIILVCLKIDIMKELVELSEKQVELVPTRFTREFISLLKKKDRMTGITGSRGTGKTTLLLQYMRQSGHRRESLYISLDDLYFTSYRLLDVADEFVKTGGRFLFIDEVHHYKNWSIELKLIYDRYPELKVTFTGSSMLHMKQGLADLSRRAVIWPLPGLSLREYINLTEAMDFPVFTLTEILKDHIAASRSIWSRIKPIQKFREYLQEGYFPYFLENRETYHIKLKETINKSLESDLPYIIEIDYAYIDKLRQLLFIISESVPFKPNIQKLSERIGLGKNTLKLYLHYLNQAGLIMALYKEGKGISLLTKPEKIYLHHPNLMYCLNPQHTNMGTIRETFFANQLHFKNTVNYTDRGDFLINRKWIFEIGGKSKSDAQIRNIPEAYLALDDIETGFKNQIPLWLFGFLY